MRRIVYDAPMDKLRSTDVRDVYHAEYFTDRVDGHAAFAAFDGTPATLFDRARRNLELLAPQPGERLLELGCGRGEVVLAAAAAGTPAVGVDFAPAALALARARQRTIEAQRGAPLPASFVAGAAAEVAFAPASFDCALLAEFIEHIAPAEAAVALRNLRGWLRPGGRVLVYTYPNVWARRSYPLMRSWANRVRGMQLPDRPEDTTHPDYQRLHLNEQSPRSLARALQRAGFVGVRVWLDTPREAGGLALLKNTPLYRNLFGYNLVATASTRAR